jgi:hypothetical protein
MRGAHVAQENKDKARWAAYVQGVLKARGWDASRLAAEAERFFGDPEAIIYKTANNWWAARAVPGAEGATAFALATGADLAESLRASGHPLLANEIAALQQGKQPRPAPTPAEQLDEFQEGIRAIKARNHPPKREAAAIANFTRRANRMVAFVLEDINDEAGDYRTAVSKSA